MNPEKFSEKFEYHDVHVGEKIKQKTKEKVPFNKSKEYAAFKNHDSRDMSDMPDVLDGMSVVGDIKDMDVKMVIAQKGDGTSVSIVEPFDAIMSGSSSVEKTYNFLEHYILSRIEPAGVSVIKGHEFKGKDLNSLIWYKNLPEFNKIISEVQSTVSEIREKFKDDSYDDNTISDFKSERGENWGKFASLRKKIFSEGIERIKKLADQTANEMRGAQDFFNSHSKDDVANEYGGFVFDGRYSKAHE